MKTAWFTVGLPEWTPQEAVRELKKQGYDGVEWRVTRDDGDPSAPSFWKGNRCTLQENWPLDKFKEVARMTADAGLAVPNLGTYLTAADLGKMEHLMEAARIMGAPTLRVNAAPYDGSGDYNELFKKAQENYAGVVELAAKYSLRPLVEIHMRTIVPSASAVYRFVSKFPAEKVGVIHDAGNMVYEGFENYKMGLEILGPYLAHVHVKNSVMVPESFAGPSKTKWTATFAPLRDGGVDFKALFAALKLKGYDGWLSFEDFSTRMSQAEKVVDNLRFLQEIFSAV